MSLDEPFDQRLGYRFVKGSTDYSLEGELAYAVPAPPRDVPEPVDPPDKLKEPKIFSPSARPERRAEVHTIDG